MPVHSKCILVLDHEKLLTDLLSLLVPESIQVIAGESCPQAESIMAGKPVDVLMINPTLTGAMDFLAKLRTLKNAPAFVAISESEDYDIMLRATGVRVIHKSEGLGPLRGFIEQQLNVELPRSWGPEVLIVDDEATVARFLESCLEAEGYTVYRASNGKEALTALDEYPEIQLVLLDIIMPGMGGMEVLTKIRETRWPPVVIMVTAVADAVVAQTALRAGAFDYIPKPLDSGKIMSAVSAGLAHFQYQQSKRWGQRAS